MKYTSLNEDAQKTVQEIVLMFQVEELVKLDKDQLGDRITELVDTLGQDGRQFVERVYTVSVQNNPLAETNPKRWLLCSFLTTMFSSWLKKHGYENYEKEEFLALASEIVAEFENI